eukprot:146202_1
MALIESLGYKQDSPRQARTRRNDSVIGSRESEHKWNSSWRHQGGNKTFLSKSDYMNDNNVKLNSHRMPNGGNSYHNDQLQMHSKENMNVNATDNKYLSLPRKSMLSSGIGFISPIPPKYKDNHNKFINKLDISNTSNLHRHAHHNSNNNNESMNLSPIKPNLLNTVPINSTLNASHNVENEKEIMIIGFPPSEATFIHRKFRAYGTVIQSRWTKNTLFLEYEYKQNAVRALVENAKWIKNGNLSYMIAVLFAEQTEKQLHGDNDTQNGRILNLNHQKPNRNQTSYFAQNYHNIERPHDLRHGPTHILWKIFEFVTTGW